jgi:hypothetical protein
VVASFDRQAAGLLNGYTDGGAISVGIIFENV